MTIQQVQGNAQPHKHPGGGTIWYLEMTTPEALQAVSPRNGAPKVRVEECARPQWQLNRFLYQFVGGPWRWSDRLSWPEQQWQALVGAANLRTWLALAGGSIAGYFELRRETTGDVEILYFGLAPDFIGQGLGGWLLSEAIASAWAWDAKRVWVHTCSMDHPAALANYQARGFSIYREEAIPAKQTEET